MLLTISARSATPDTLLTELYDVLANQHLYDDQKNSQINEYRDQMDAASSPSERFLIYDALYSQYQSFKYDSAFRYATELIRLGYLLDDDSRIGYGKVKLGFILLSSGMFKETFDTLNTVSGKVLKDSVQREYYSLMARAYYDVSDYDKDNYYSDRYRKFGNAYVDSAMMVSEQNSYTYQYLKGLKNLRNRRFDMAQNDLNKLLSDKSVELSLHEYAIVSSTLSYIYLNKQDTLNAVHLLAQASIADIKAATKETAAMLSLSEILFRLGELEDADNLIKKAVADAEFYGAKQRKMQVGAVLPVITAAKLADVESQRRLLIFYASGITILVITVLIFSLIISKQYKKLKSADDIIQKTNADLRRTVNKLQEANKIKDEYIGYYFNINSEYLNKIEKLKKDVDRKLMSKKYDEIKYVINNIHLKTEREKLYYNFDRVFLKLFPDFVEKFNQLFDDESKIQLESNELLNTELRIFALIRLGITDSDKIAGILGYSVNTIYSYKNRVKSKSRIPNEQFEAEIMSFKAE